MINVVVAQFPVTFSIQRNLGFIDSVLARTNVGDLVVFPEGALSGYSTDPSFVMRIECHTLMTGLEYLQRAAVEREINLWVGACVCENGEWFNAAYGFFADGKTQVYRKINLAHHERGIVSAGNVLPVFELHTPEGKIVVGVQICRELRFPEQWAWLARRGAQIILHLNNTVGDEAFRPVWKSHLVSRAAETQRFVLSANTAASAQLCPTMAVAPDGQIMGEIVSEKPEMLRVGLDLTRVSIWYLDQSRAVYAANFSGLNGM